MGFRRVPGQERQGAQRSSTAPRPAQIREDTLKMIASQLKAIGIKVTANDVSSTDIFAPGTRPRPTRMQPRPRQLRRRRVRLGRAARSAGRLHRLHSTQGIPEQPPPQRPERHAHQHPGPGRGLQHRHDAPSISAKVQQAMYTVQDIYTSDQNTTSCRSTTARTCGSWPRGCRTSPATRVPAAASGTSATGGHQ